MLQFLWVRYYVRTSGRSQEQTTYGFQTPPLFAFPLLGCWGCTLAFIGRHNYWGTYICRCIEVATTQLGNKKRKWRRAFLVVFFVALWLKGGKIKRVPGL